MICSARFIIINMFLLVCTIHYRTFIVILDEIACFSYKNDSVVFCMYVFCLGNVVQTTLGCFLLIRIGCFLLIRIGCFRFFKNYLHVFKILPIYHDMFCKIYYY